MRRTVLKIAALMLTCALGIGISIGWKLYQWSLEPYEVSPIAPWPLGTPPQPRIRTDEITIVGGMDACGSEGSFHMMELSDGTQLSHSCERFSSSSAAASALKSRLLNAESAERVEERDASGRVVGEKVLIIGSRVKRLSRSGISLCVTDAPSFRHLLLFESGALHQAPSNSGSE